MRRLLLLLTVVLIGVAALSNWRPGAASLQPTPAPTLTPLPDDFTLIPPFTPAYPCELQNVDVYDEALCRSESVQEQALMESESVTFIRHDYHMGAGCWGSVSQDIHELRVCHAGSGETTTLTTNLVTDLYPSPDGEWLAFGMLNPLSTEGDAMRPHVYRVRHDGTGLQRLDAHGFPDFAIGAPRDLRWLDDSWLALKVWDGSGDAGWHPYRLKADGSGSYEPLPDAARSNKRGACVAAFLPVYGFSSPAPIRQRST